MRFTRFLTCNVDGSDLYAFNIEKQVSHYTWKSKDEIICVLNQAGKESSYTVFTDKCDKEKRMGEGVLRSDGHPSFLSDHNLLLTDTYPDKFGDQNLLLYNNSKNTLKHLGAFYSPSRYFGERRCDLHPRWSPSNNYIVFDSTHEGRRGIYLFQVDTGLFK
jgi:Tol biopolymer transport system component